MNPSMQSMVVCEEATLAEGGYVLTHPGIEFESNSIDVFCEIRELHQGVLLRALLLGPDGERCDFSPEELVPQNIPYLQCAFVLGGSDLSAGPYRVQVLADNIIIEERDVILGAAA